MRTHPLDLAFALAAGLSFASQADAGIFTNGSFENPVVTTYGVSPASAGLANWISTGSQQVLERNGLTLGIPAFDGLQYVSFGHNGTSGSLLAQTFDTTTGVDYSFSFATTAIQGSAPQTLRVTVRDASGLVLNSLDADASSIGWTLRSLSFNAVSNSSVIEFSDIVGAAGANIGLDAVTLVPSPGAMPLLAYLGALAARRRRR